MTDAQDDVAHHIAHSGGRRACAHPAHRFPVVPNSPARVILPECAGRDAWLRARRDGIGGSEVGALIGVNEHETPFSVWSKKQSGETKDLSDVPAVEWGHRMEEVVAQKTAEQAGVVSRFGGGLWARTDRPYLRVTPDRLATRPRSWKAIGVIESKTAGSDEHWRSGTITPGGQGTGSAPLSYQAQVQWQLGILGLKVGWLGCFVMGMERNFHTVEIHYDRGWFSEMAHAAEQFWVDHVQGDEIPMHDLRHPITEGLLKDLNPEVVRPSVDLPEGSEGWLTAYHQAKVRLAEAERDMDEATNFFRLWTGDAGAGYLGTRKVVSYPTCSTSRVDVAKLREEYPEVAEAVTVRSTYRRLTVTVPKHLKVTPVTDGGAG